MQKRVFLSIIYCSFALIANSQSRNLDYYLKEGSLNSPLLNDYRNRLLSASSDSLLIKAAKKPLIEANSLLQYSPYGRNFGYDEVITDGGNYSAVVGISQNIFNKRELNNKYEAARLLGQSDNNAAKISARELNRVITNQYLSAFSDYSDLQFNRNFLDLFSKENEIVEKLVSSGAGKQTDYLSLLVETQAQENLVRQLRNQYRKDLMLLNQLCGLYDTATYELSEPLLEITGSGDVAMSPSYIQYKIDSLKLENEKAAIDIRYKPKVNWFADAGMMTSNPWNFYRHFGFSGGLNLNIPIYNGRQREIEKNKIVFQENTRQSYENNYRSQYYLQIKQYENELRALDEISMGLEKQMKTSELLVRTFKNQLEAGIVQMTDYINAVKNLRTAGRNLNLLKIQKIQVINEINSFLNP